MNTETHVGDGVDVGSGQAEVAHDLQAAVVGGQVQRGPAVLVQREKNNLSKPGDTTQYNHLEANLLH